MERGTGILRRLCRLRAVSAIVLTFGQNRRYFIPLPVLRPELPDGRTTGSLREPCSKNQHPSLRWVLIFGAGYGNRTRLCGLGSDRSTDELTLHIKLLEQGTGILRRLRRLRVPAHFLLSLPKAAMPCIAPSYDGKMLVIEPAFRGLEDTAFCR